MLWFLYALGVVLVWYENMGCVRAGYDRPLCLSRGFSQITFWFVRCLVTYGSLVGLWATHNFATAAIAFVAYYAFNKLTFRIHFNREVRRWARYYADKSREEAMSKRQCVNEAAVLRQAHEEALTYVVDCVKGRM